METNVVDERVRFACDVLSGQWSMVELCERYGVTRPTGYKWLARYRTGGAAALEDRSRGAAAVPPTTAPDADSKMPSGNSEPRAQAPCAKAIHAAASSSA